MNEESLSCVIDRYMSAITCFCFMGGDSEPREVERLARWIKSRYPSIKTAWYSGKEYIPSDFDLSTMDYVKTGPFIEALGGLKSPVTNQALFRVNHDGTMTRIIMK